MKRNSILSVLTLLIIGSVQAQDCAYDSTYAYNAQDEVHRKTYFTRNAQGLPIETIRVDSSAGVWTNGQRLLETWDADENITERIEQSWTGTQWQNSQRYSYSYDLSGNQLSSNTEIWIVGTSSWQQSSFQFYHTYDVNGLKTETIQVYVNPSNGNPEDSVLTTFLYNGDDNEIFNQRNGWSIGNPVWNPIQRYTTTYVGLLADSIYNEAYNASTTSWNLLSTCDYTYDAYNRKIEELWATPSSNNYKQNFNYDVNDNLIFSSYSTWDYLNNLWQWRVNNQQTNTYSASNKLETVIGEVWNPTTQSLVNQYTVEHTYNANDCFEWWYYELWNQGNSTWDPNSKTQYFYGGLASTSHLTKGVFKSYPNPVVDELKIETSENDHITIFNSLGNLVFEEELGSGVNALNLSHLAPGIYVLKSAKGQQAKVIKQ